MLFKRRSSVPTLGRIPTESPSEGGLRLLRANDERLSYAAAFQSLYASVAFLPVKHRVLVVTSAMAGEGKSTVASNLAITMALAGARVLLVDADLRRGNLGDLFGVGSEPGLSNVLRGEMPALKSTGYENLSLLPCGPPCNESGDLLVLPGLREITAGFREEFAFTVLNTSPILATNDTQLLAPHCDGVLLVIRQSSPRLVSDAMKELRQRGIPILGTVLNCPEPVTSGA